MRSTSCARLVYLWAVSAEAGDGPGRLVTGMRSSLGRQVEVVGGVEVVEEMVVVVVAAILCTGCFLDGWQDLISIDLSLQSMDGRARNK